MLHPLDKAYVLHARPYRDTSLLVDFLTYTHGRVSVIARGAKQPKSALKGILQPFIPLQIQWYGKNELGSLKIAEIEHAPFILSEKYLLSGLYINELLTRVLSRDDPYPQLLLAYEITLQALSERQNPEPLLRTFELKLLKTLGYGLQLDRLADTGLPIEPEKSYYYRVLHGVISVAPHHTQSKQSQDCSAFLGAHLIAIQQGDFADKETLKTAKRVLRLALAALLGDKPILSRTLFVTER